MKATGGKAAAKRPRLKRKNLILDQAKIDRAKAVLGAATDTETISRALDAVNELAAFRMELDRGFDDLIGRGGFTDHFDSAPR